MYVITGSGEKKTYTRKKLTTGLSDGINIQIKSGLTRHDKVRGPKVVKETTTEE